MVTNRGISDKLDEFGRILELKEANVFKIRAFQNAARTVQSLSKNIENLYKEGGIEAIQEIDGIGDSISKIIKEYIETGSIEELEELKEDIPPGFIDMMAIEGLGPKSINKLHKSLNISTIEDLEKAAKSGKISDIKGFGKKTEENILDGIDRFRRSGERSLRMYVEPIANQYVQKLKDEFQETIKRIEIAGSMRRKRSTVGDVDILIQAPEDNAEAIMSYFTDMDDVSRVLVSGTKKTSIINNTDLQIDVRVIEDASQYAAHLQYFTGSKEHNIEVRKIAIDKDLKLNEYGLQQEDGDYLDLTTEEQIYNHLGLQFVPPELREDRGEIDLALEHNLPELVTREMVKADFHVHSIWSEGNDTIKDMATHAMNRGLEYMVFTDHTQDLVIANGMDEEKTQNQITKIREVNDELSGIELFAGAELNIRNDGSLDLNDETLEMLDFTIASIHSGFKQDSQQLTSRIITALEHEKVNVIAHPTGRQVNKRDPYEIDLDRVVEAASEHGVALEINGSQRQDLSDIILHSLRNENLRFSLASDAHAMDQLINLEYAIDLARRGWVDPNKIINTMTLDGFKSFYNLD